MHGERERDRERSEYGLDGMQTGSVNGSKAYVRPSPIILLYIIRQRSLAARREPASDNNQHNVGAKLHWMKSVPRPHTRGRPVRVRIAYEIIASRLAVPYPLSEPAFPAAVASLCTAVSTAKLTSGERKKIPRVQNQMADTHHANNEAALLVVGRDHQRGGPTTVGRGATGRKQRVFSPGLCEC